MLVLVVEFVLLVIMVATYFRLGLLVGANPITRAVGTTAALMEVDSDDDDNDGVALVVFVSIVDDDDDDNEEDCG